MSTWLLSTVRGSLTEGNVKIREKCFYFLEEEI